MLLGNSARRKLLLFTPVLSSCGLLFQVLGEQHYWNTEVKRLSPAGGESIEGLIQRRDIRLKKWPDHDAPRLNPENHHTRSLCREFLTAPNTTEAGHEEKEEKS